MPARHSILLYLSIALAVLYLLGTVFGGIALGEIALHPPSHPVRQSEERNAEAAAQQNSVEFRDVELVTRDGASLRAWFMRPQEANGNVVILLHGVTDNRLGMYGYGRWLLENHYSVLLPDARHHGNSGGLTTYGIKEANDIHQWVDWIETNKHPHCVYGLGESMGAAELLQSLTRESRFCAVIAESPFATFREVVYARFGRPFRTGPWLGRTFFRPAVDVGFLYVRIRYGLNMEDAAPERAVVCSRVPVLLIHGLNDRNIPPYHSDLIQARNPESVVVWKVPGAVHTGVYKAAPEEFNRRVLSWFAEHSG
jgi:pimeloyl-ACP methyl ester carboxylesterase